DTIRAQAEAILAANYPGDPESPDDWPGWARILPHVLAFRMATNESADAYNLAVGAAYYLIKRGDARSGHGLARTLYQRWRGQLGTDDPYTLRAANTLGVALNIMGR